MTSETKSMILLASGAVVAGLLIGAALLSLLPTKAEWTQQFTAQCTARWQGRDVSLAPDNTCLVKIDGNFVPEKNVVITTSEKK